MRLHPASTVVFLLLTACAPAAPGPSPMAGHDHGMMMGGGDVGKYLPSDTIDAKDVFEAGTTEIISVGNGQTIRLSPMVVKKKINGREYVMFGYNGQIPGPLIKAEQGSEFHVEVTNKLPLPTTNHWHGLRLDNAFDGMPGISQDEIQTGDTFRYTVKIPDAGLFWYHPHVREDIEQDLGLYGNILVTPKDAPSVPADREEVLILDDLLLDAFGGIVPYGRDGANYAMMGRYGNTFLLNGETEYSLDVSRGDVVRFYLTNTANARPFRIRFENARMKLVGSDGGLYEKEEMVDDLIISPSERYVVDVLFGTAGTQRIFHTGSGEPASLGTVRVADTPGAESAHEGDFLTLRDRPEAIPSSSRLQAELEREPDEVLRVSSEGMNHGTVTDGDGIEWEDSMPMMNAMTNQNNFTWKLVDDRTGKANMDVHWEFEQGAFVKIRIINDHESMQHPIHFHGQRFVVLSVNGEPAQNRVWKDTFLLRTGETADILVEMSNPGTWMFHCHIAEHLQAGMMGLFTVKEP